MIKVGLTGNIGSGKSTVARIFETLGVPVYHSDKKAKEFLFVPEVKERLKIEFGQAVFTGTVIDRKKLAKIVFNNKKAIGFLNSLIHPLVRNDFENWCLLYNNEPYVIQEAAILFESGFYKLFDKTIVVICSEEIIVQRVMERDEVEEVAVRERMKNQWRQEEKMKFANYVISNDNEQLVIPQVLEIHRELQN